MTHVTPSMIREFMGAADTHHIIARDRCADGRRKVTFWYNNEDRAKGETFIEEVVARAKQAGVKVEVRVTGSRDYIRVVYDAEQ